MFSCKLLRRVIAGAALAPIVLLTGWSSPRQEHSGMPRAERHEIRHEIGRLEEKWCDAILKSDVSALASLMADDYVGITAYGTLQTKDETLSSLREGTWHFSTLNITERKIRFYGTTALVTSLVEVKGTGPAGDVSGDYRYSRVYARSPQGTWKIVNFEASRISEPGEHKF